MVKHWIFILLAVLLLSGCGGSKSPGDSGSPAEAKPPVTGVGPIGKQQWAAPPAMQIDLAKRYEAVMTTEFGEVRIELFAKEVPMAVNNFVFLARQGFYNGLVFHRVSKDFMIQGGDPKGDGTGNPGYKFADELPVKRPYDPGIVAYANSGANTQGSQFFICTGPACGGLNSPQYAKYTQFGKVTAGMDTVMKLASVEVGPNSRGELSKPTTPPVIKSIKIEER